MRMADASSDRTRSKFLVLSFEQGAVGGAEAVRPVILARLAEKRRVAEPVPYVPAQPVAEEQSGPVVPFGEPLLPTSEVGVDRMAVKRHWAARSERQGLGDFGELGGAFVSLRQERIVDLPVDPDVGVVPSDAGLGQPVIIAGEQVGDFGDVAEHVESLAEADRDEELAVLDVVEHVPLPLARGGGGSADAARGGHA